MPTMPGARSVTLADRLRQARGLIEQRGWWNGSGDPTGLCLVQDTDRVAPTTGRGWAAEVRVNGSSWLAAVAGELAP